MARDIAKDAGRVPSPGGFESVIMRIVVVDSAAVDK